MGMSKIIPAKGGITIALPPYRIKYQLWLDDISTNQDKDKWKKIHKHKVFIDLKYLRYESILQWLHPSPHIIHSVVDYLPKQVTFNN